jgi:hypothetical protein
MLYGYKKKTHPANWTTTPAGQQAIAASNAQKRARKAPRTRLQCRNPHSPTSQTWKRIAPVAKSKVRGRSADRVEARAFVQAAIERGETCPVFAVFARLSAEMQRFLTQPWDGQRRSSKLAERHHTHGRLGANLSYQPWWLVLSKWGHRAVHAFPNEARQWGWICPLGQWNKLPQNEMTQ